MLFLFGFGRRSLLGHVLYGVRSALLVGAALLVAPWFLDVNRSPDQASAALDTAAAGRALRGGHAMEARNAGHRQARPVTKGKGGELTGRVTHVRDGDTVEVDDIAVRIANLDCPERGTDAGWRATRAMYRLSEAGPLTCRLSGRRSYDREVGTCQMADGRDLGQVMISEGVCSRWR